MLKGNDAFERSLRNTLDPYEVPYNSADWAQLEKHLDKGQGSGRWQSATGLIALLLGGSLAIATTVHLMVNEPILADGAGIVGMDEVSSLVNNFTRTDAFKDRSEDLQPANETFGPSSTILNKEPLGIAEVAPSSKQSSPTAPGSFIEPPTEQPIPTGAPGEKAIHVSITEGCPGTTVDFAMNNVPEDGIYLWNFGDGSFSNKPKPSHTFSKPGTFEVMLSHSSLSGGKFANKPVSDRIVIHEVPDASFQFIKREYENTIPSVHFENRSVGGKSYHWDFGDGSTSTIPHPDHVYKTKGSYTVTLTASNTNGCVDRVERNVRIDADYNLLATNTFSPNSDGVDDTFIPEALLALGVRFHMSIFDAKSGDLVYETSDAQRPWNGRVGNKGDRCAPGEYLWMVDMKDGEKLGGSYNGSLDLLR